MLYDEHKKVIWQSAGGYVKKFEKPGVGRPLLGPAIITIYIKFKRKIIMRFKLLMTQIDDRITFLSLLNASVTQFTSWPPRQPTTNILVTVYSIEILSTSSSIHWRLNGQTLLMYHPLNTIYKVSNFCLLQTWQSTSGLSYILFFFFLLPYAMPLNILIVSVVLVSAELRI